MVTADNLKAFLSMIAHSEGTSTAVGSDNGYNVIVGGTLFHDYKDHPRRRVFCRHINTYSSAAGRYQLLARYWDSYKKSLNLTDFSPANQDAVAIQQIKERGALGDIDAGRFDLAVDKCCNIWASLPGNNYGQHENKLSDLREIYVKFGGTLIKA